VQLALGANVVALAAGALTQSSPVAGVTFRGVEMYSGTTVTGFIVGDNSTILRYDGSNWNVVSYTAGGGSTYTTLCRIDSNVLYVGMGESCIRGNVAHGDGVYKSTDAGKSWQHLGLADTRHISKVRIHPTNPELVYIAALGHAHGPNAERGIFRSRDGGATWLALNSGSYVSGAIGLAIRTRRRYNRSQRSAATAHRRVRVSCAAVV
jgi:photosystem II stability/assembly factor-like uncharacterized protein